VFSVNLSLMQWDPTQYLKFADHRLRPAIDLMGRITLESPNVVYDLGAGTGTITEMLASRWHDAKVIGVDNSPEMLGEASKLGTNVEWQVSDLAEWIPDHHPDLIYSNAALHWLGDHESLFTQLVEYLETGGVLAVQMPRNFQAQSHTLIAEAVRSGPWREKLEPLLNPSPVEPPDYYIRILKPYTETLDVWETDYSQILTGPNPVKEWTKGTWLRPLLAALGPPERDQFELKYSELVRDAYPPMSDGSTVFPFRRLFIVATKK